MYNQPDPYAAPAVDPYNQIPIAQTAGYVPTGQTLMSQEGITKWLQNPKEIIKEITLKLQGREFNKETKSYQQVRPPLLSEEGVKIVVASLDFHINRVVTLSNFDEHMINIMSYEAIIAIANSLQQNWVKSGIIRDPLPDYSLHVEVGTVYLPNNHIAFTRNGKVINIMQPRFDSSLFKLVVDNVDHIIYANLRRAEGGKERKFLTMITQESIQKIERDGGSEQKEGGIGSKIFGFPSLFGKK